MFVSSSNILRVCIYLLQTVLLVSAYFCTGWLGLRLSQNHPSMLLIWPPTGLALAVLVRWGVSYWPGVWVGALAVQGLNGFPLLVSANIATGNTLGLVLAVHLLRKMDFNPVLTRSRDVLAFVLVGTLGAPAFAAGNAVLTLYGSGLLPRSASGLVWVAWWLAEVTGTLVVGPPLLTWQRQSLSQIRRGRLLEVFTLGAGLLGIGVLLFVPGTGVAELELPAQFLLFPFLIWAAVRQGIWVTSLVILVITGLAVGGTAAGVGPFHHPHPRVGLGMLWAYTTSTGLTALLLAALQAERAQALAAVRVSEARYRNIFDHAVEGIFQSTPEGRFLHGNPALARIYGFASPEELRAHITDIGQQIYVEPSRRAEFQQQIQERGLVVGFEFQIRRQDGTTSWVTESARAVRDPLGGLLYYEGTVEDISERKRAEEALRASQQMLSLVLNNIPQGVFWKDRQSVYLGCNQPVLQAHGLEHVEQVRGRTDHELPGLTCAQADFFVQTDRAVMAANLPQLKIEEPLTRADGTTIWLETAKVPLHDAQGQVIGILGTWQDITERKRSEAALRRSNELLSALSHIQARFISGMDLPQTFANILAVLVSVTDSQGGFVGEVVATATGQPTLRIHAASNCDWAETQRELFAVHLPMAGEFDSLETLFGRFLANQQPLIVPHPETTLSRNRLFTGQPPVRSFLGLPFLCGEELVGLAGILNCPEGYNEATIRFLEPFLYTCTNLLGGLRMERARRQAEERMREALHEKEALLKEIHHRVKNNLQIISSLLNLQAAQLADPAARPAFLETQNRIRSMALLHETLYRTERLARIDFRQYVTDLCAYLLRSFGVDTRRIHLRTDVGHVSLDMDRAIPCGLIITELVSNALKYAFPAQRAGELLVRVQTEPNDVCLLSVADTGIGLPTEVEARQSGTLGLKIVNDLVQQLQGQLVLDRSAGTCFTVRFPVQGVAAVPTMEKPSGFPGEGRADRDGQGTH